MRRHGRSVTPTVSRGPGRRTIVLRLDCDRYSLTVDEAVHLANALIDATEQHEEENQA